MAVRFARASSEYWSLTSSLPAGSSNWTWMAWVYPISYNASSWSSVFSPRINGVDCEFAFTNGSSPQNISLWNGSTETASAGTYATGAWYHLALTKSSGTVTAYVNGGQIAQQTGGNAWPNTGTTAGYYVGEWSGTGDYFDGRMAAVKMWARALTGAEIANEINVMRPADATSLWGWWPAIETGAGNRNLDYSGNGRTWTETNTPSDEDPPPVSWGAGMLLPALGSGGTIISLASTVVSLSASPNADLSLGLPLAHALTSFSSTPDTDLSQIAPLTAIRTSLSATPDVDLLLAHGLSPVITSLSTTQDTDLSMIVPIAAARASLSTTPDTVDLLLSGLIALASTLASLSTTPTADLSLMIPIAATATSTSLTPDTVDLLLTGLVALASAIASTSSTPDTDLSLITALASARASLSTTPDVDLLLAHVLSPVITSLSTTPDVDLSLVIPLASAPASLSTTPDIDLLLAGIVGLVRVTRAIRHATVSRSVRQASVTRAIRRATVTRTVEII